MYIFNCKKLMSINYGTPAQFLICFVVTSSLRRCKNEGRYYSRPETEEESFAVGWKGEHRHPTAPSILQSWAVRGRPHREAQLDAKARISDGI